MFAVSYKKRDGELQGVSWQKLVGLVLPIVPVLSLLVLTGGLEAAPTVDLSGDSPITHCDFSLVNLPTLPINFDNIRHVPFALEIAKSRNAPETPSTSHGSTVKSLPAVPTAVAMVLIGFFCVSFVRDRRVWLTGLSTLLLVSQAGVRTVPQLANHLLAKNHSGRFISRSNGDSCIIDYAGVRHLNIDFTRRVSLLDILRGSGGGKLLSRHLYFSSSDNTLKQGMFLAENSFFSVKPFKLCLALTGEFFVCLKPGFSFGAIPRGPPVIA